MKNVLVTISLVLTAFNALALPVHTSRLEDYKTGVKIALLEHPVPCIAETGDVYEDSLLAVIEKATSAELQMPGAQPLVVFTYGTETERTTASVTTSADNRTVMDVKIEAATLVSESFNLGDIAQPNIVTRNVWKTVGIVICH
ncbi:MAG: hypothetical protein H7326_07030 [Bdellovibrionaceae bacterium]|nr:hypothetical protein [Pseudobdellovibrionaceae bacterium]